MTATVSQLGINFAVEDVSGQKHFNINNYNRNSTVGDMINGLTKKMGLPTTDAEGNTTVYRAFSKADSKHLDNSEIVGDALKPGDSLVLQPNVNAGSQK